MTCRACPSAGLSCCLPRDTMSLTGLLSAIADDPQFRQVADLASVDGGGVAPVDGADVTAPAVAGRRADRPARPRHTVPARGHRNRQGSGRTGRGPELAAARKRRGLLPRLGDAAA